MGYFGHFFVKSKAFEIQTVIGFKGIHFAKWRRGTIRAVMMGKTSVVWLRKTMEDLIKGAEIKDFYRSTCCGNDVLVAQRRSNGYGHYLELLEYGGGGWRGFIVFPEGHEGKGWAECATQLRKVQDLFVALAWYGSTSNNARLGATIEGSAVPEKS